MTEYSPYSDTWRNMPSLQQDRGVNGHHCVCTLDSKIFVLGGDYGEGTSCEMLDLCDVDPQWRYISSMNSQHHGGAAVVIERKIYVLSSTLRLVKKRKTILLTQKLVLWEMTVFGIFEIGPLEPWRNEFQSTGSHRLTVCTRVKL